MTKKESKVKSPKKRFLNVLGYLKKISTNSTGDSGQNVSDLLLPFVGKMMEFESVLREVIPVKIEALNLDFSIKDWHFVAYGYLRQDQELILKLENMYRPTYAHLQAQGFIMALPEDFVTSIIWDTVIEIRKEAGSTEPAPAVTVPPPPPGTQLNRRADD